MSFGARRSPATALSRIESTDWLISTSNTPRGLSLPGAFGYGNGEPSDYFGLFDVFGNVDIVSVGTIKGKFLK